MEKITKNKYFIGIIVSIIISITVLIIYKTVNIRKKSAFIVSSIDKRIYRVIEEFYDKNDAVNIMAEVNAFIFDYLKYMRNKYKIKKKGQRNEIEFVERMLNNYNPDNILENDPLPGEDTSYVINKGDEFGICLRNKSDNPGKIHDIDIIKFVVLHELAHLGNITYGHEYDFWAFFKFILINAVEADLYTPVNYRLTPVNYCGLEITFSPYYSNYDWKNL
jgi:hypothetical protein